MVFQAQITGKFGGVNSHNDTGIWAVDTGGTLNLVVRKGDAVAVDGNLKFLSSLSLFTSSPGTAGQSRSFNRSGGLVYLATFTDKTQAIQKVVLP